MRTAVPKAPGPRVADIIRRYGRRFLRSHTANRRQRRIMAKMAACRTAQLGGHRRECRTCGHVDQAYNSCGDRHCNTCQAGKRAEWLAAREQDLLPVEYFHVVFTLPQALSPLALQNPRAVYGLLMASVAETLKHVGRQRLGAQLGILSVLHTWGQNLMHHPHVHAIVPGGGLNESGDRWISCPSGFFLPVRVLSTVFRAKFVAGLRKLHQAGKLSFHGRLLKLGQQDQFEQFLDALFKQAWVVYAKPPFGGPLQVLKYLARYTHRVAISNQRLLQVNDRNVAFRWKDYRRRSRSRSRMLTLTVEEFLRRFLLHVLPSRFVRIRQYGFLANGVRRRQLELCRKLLLANKRGEMLSSDSPQAVETINETATQDTGRLELLCPRCQSNHWLTTIMPRPIGVEASWHDTS